MEGADPRITRRAAFFAGMAAKVADNFPMLREQTEFRADAPVLIAHAYFLLNDAHKSRRSHPDSLTDEYKRAALSALAVMAIRPFAPLEPDNVTSMPVYLANPILALACANAWAADRNLFEHFPFDYLKRFYFSLDAVELRSLSRFVDAANEGGDYRQIASIDMDWRETALIDDWVLKIYMLCRSRR